MSNNNRQQQIDTLTEELYDRPPGYRTVLEIVPGGQQGGLDYGPLVVEIVVLDTSGSSVAYQISSDQEDSGWQLGDTADAVDALIDRRETIAEQENEPHYDYD